MAKREWASGGSPLAGTRLFAIICTVVALPLLVTAVLLTEDRLALVARVLATPRGDLAIAGQGRAFHQGQLHGPPGRTTPLGNSAAAWIGTVRWTTGSGKSNTSHSCVSGELDGLLLGDSPAIDLLADGFTLERGHTSGGRPADTSKLRPECVQHLGQYEEQFFKDGDLVTVAACGRPGPTGSPQLTGCQGEQGAIAAGTIGDKHVAAIDSARLRAWILIMLAAAFSVVALVAHLHSDRRFVLPEQEGDS
jgi:hypothetical protein